MDSLSKTLNEMFVKLEGWKTRILSVGIMIAIFMRLASDPSALAEGDPEAITEGVIGVLAILSSITHELTLAREKALKQELPKVKLTEKKKQVTKKK